MELSKKIKDRSVVLGIVGLGYVGLPLAVEFGKKFNVIGFDINTDRIDELKKGIDKTLEVSAQELQETKNLRFTSNLNDLEKAEVFIVTVPTPVDSFKRPDLTPLLKASESVSKVLYMNRLFTRDVQKKIVSRSLKNSAG
jgi:UDP-N-acetyl-D-galactosamine dehydrogenase